MMDKICLSLYRYTLIVIMLCSSTVVSFSTRVTVFRRPLAGRRWASVTGTVYTSEDDDLPSVTLFTKEGCTLCDKVKDILLEVKDTHPHSLYQMDITDESHRQWWERYKYDIPVLHLNDEYWCKHRLTVEDAREGLEAATEDPTYISPNQQERPNAAAQERT